MSFFSGMRVGSRWSRGLFSCALAALLSGLLVAPARADAIATRSATLSAAPDGYRLEAAFDIRMPAGLLEAVNRGLPAHFVVEFELSKARRYWFDDRPVKLARTYTLTYLPLLKQYRLVSGSASQSFRRVEDALQALARVRSWPVADVGALEPGAAYTAAIRLRLDTARLPKPLQLSAVASQEWSFASDWYRWSVDP